MTQAEQFIKARSKCKICPNELLTFIWGSKAIHSEIADYANKVAANDLDYPPMLSERSRSDQISWVIKSSRKYQEIMETDLGIKPPPDAIFSDGSRLVGGVGLGMTLSIIDLMGTDAQKQKWIGPIQAGDIICCYGQTELSHGSDVQSLQTTAIFDQKQDSFIINTPSIGAYKFWPGDMGISSNYVMVYAQVITHGKTVGVLPLFFQVRDMDTHKLLPGVEAGDIGAKFGYFHKENGFMSFTNYKVPRDALLGRYVNVDAAGKFTQQGDMKVFYSAMMVIREAVICSVGKIINLGVLSTLRYSHIRTQFKISKTHERPIIDYQAQRAKIYPLLAKSYAVHFTSQKISEEIAKSGKLIAKGDFGMLKEMHIQLSVTKGLYTTWGNDALFLLMQACGGHGYLEAAGFGPQLNRVFPSAIYEGVNTMLLMQVATELDKTFRKVFKEGASASTLNSLKYFKDGLELLEYQAPSNKDSARDFGVYWKVFAKCVLFYVKKSALQRQELVMVQKKIGPRDAFDMKSGITLQDASILHGILITLQFFSDKIVAQAEGPMKKAFSKLVLMFAVDQLLTMSSQAFEAKAVTAEFLGHARDLFEDLLDEIHEDAMVLAEGFQWPESYLENNHVLARADGKIYENLMGFTKKYGMLNQIDVHPTMLEYIKNQKELQANRHASKPKL